MYFRTKETSLNGFTNLKNKKNEEKKRKSNKYVIQLQNYFKKPETIDK